MGATMIIGTLGSMLSLAGAVFCTVFYEWKRSDNEASQGSLAEIYHAEGLWIRCVVTPLGMKSCDYYDTTIFDVPSFLQAVRGLSIISCILLLCSTICNIAALDCCTCVATKTRVWSTRMGGSTSALAGILLTAAVSWYAATVIQEFNDAFNYVQQGFLYTFGSALYVGWVAGGLAFVCGAAVLCLSCRSDFEDDDRLSYTYKPPKSRPHEEYV